MTDAFDRLTPRQLEIVRALTQDRQAQEIAHDLFITPDTLKNHVVSIKKTLGARTRAGIVYRYAQWERERNGAAA
jgi:DNA-binding NarL/FixJ family response regulator